MKRNYILEKYLNLKNSDLRKSITQLRVSAHPLPVEKLRRLNIPYHERICDLCDSAEIGTEEHTIMYCDNTNVKNLRNKLFEEIKYVCPQFASLNNQCKFIYLLLCTDSISFYFGIFLTKLYKLVKM